jgi:hypothetical protein
MADFNVNLEAPHASGAQVIKPVQDNVSNFSNPWVSVVGGLAEAFIKNKAESTKKEAEDREQAILGDFVRSQTSIADAIDQGLPPDQARLRARSNFSKYSANYPKLVEEFSKKDKALFEFSALGDAKAQGQSEAEVQKNLRNSAVQAGIVIPENAPPALVKTQLASYQDSVRFEQEAKKLAARRQEARAEAAETRSATEFQITEDTVTLLTTTADAKLKPSMDMMKFIIDDVKRTGDIKGGKAKMLEHFIGIESALTAAASFNPQLAEPYKKLFAEIKKFGEESIDPKTTAEQSSNQLKALENKVKLVTLADPRMKALYGASYVTNGQIQSLFTTQNKDVLSAYARITHQFGGDASDIVGRGEYEGPIYGEITEQVKLLEAGKVPNPEGTKQQLGNGVNNILKQVGKAAASEIKTEQLSKAFSFIASPEYAVMMGKGVVSPKEAQSAHKIFSMVYEKEVANGLEKRLAEPFRSGTVNDKSYGDLVSFSWNGASVTAEGSGKQTFTPMESGDRDVFLRDMKKSTIVINQLIQAGSHLEGHTDYQKYWETNKHNILSSIYPDPKRLAVGQTVTAKNGKKYKYLGGNYNDITNSYQEVSGGE